MFYSFELIKHANIRYRESIPVLAHCELFAMLSSLGISCVIQHEQMGGSQFLTFECRELNDHELTFLAGHSSFVFMSEKQGDLLHPLSVTFPAYLPDDLPEVLKYKGKTNATFTRMVINTAAALSRFYLSQHPLILFDPVCGKGTSCFCAAAAGMDAVGLDLDRKDIREAVDYFSRYLKYHRLKHEEKCRAETSAKQSIPVTSFRFADTKEHYQAGNTRTISFACADTSESPSLFRKEHAHIIVADLPYGIQHAPQSGTKPEPLQHFLNRALPVWKKVLIPGGVIALSFNTLTLPTQEVRNALTSAGYHLLKNDIFSHLSHEVEQAVVRDLVFAFNTQEESVI